MNNGRGEPAVTQRAVGHGVCVTVGGKGEGEREWKRERRGVTENESGKGETERQGIGGIDG